MPFDPIIAASIVLIAWVVLRMLGGERRQRLDQLHANLAKEAEKQSKTPEPAPSVR